MEFRLKDAEHIKGFTTVKVWEYNGLSVSLGQSHYDKPVEVVTVHLDVPKLCVIGGQRFHDMIMEIRKKHIPDDAAYAAYLEAIMTTLLLDIGWVAFVTMISAQMESDKAGWIREGHRKARQDLHNWLAGRDL